MVYFDVHRFPRVLPLRLPWFPSRHTKPRYRSLEWSSSRSRHTPYFSSLSAGKKISVRISVYWDKYFFHHVLDMMELWLFRQKFYVLEYGIHHFTNMREADDIESPFTINHPIIQLKCALFGCYGASSVITDTFFGVLLVPAQTDPIKLKKIVSQLSYQDL